MSSSILTEIEKGPTFAVYQGPRGMQRLDWTRNGQVRAIFVGHAEPENAIVLIQRLEQFVRSNVRTTTLYDCWDLTGYESGLRIELTKWGQRSRATNDGIHMISRSKIVNMGISVANLAMGGRITVYGKRPEFDLLCKKFGFPINPLIPALAAMHLS